MKKSAITKSMLIASFVVGVTISVTTLSSCVSLSNYNLIDIAEVQKSPYNWYKHQINGHDTYSTYPGGAYLKFEFNGSTLGLRGWCSSSFPSHILLNCYIDDSITPIQKNWSNALGDILIFSNSLKSGTVHKAFIVVSSINQDSNTRWQWPDCFNVLNVLLGKNNDVLPPSNLIDDRVLLYGDSITEANIAGAENQVFAMLSRQYGYEYGQVGWESEAISKTDGLQAPQFYIDNDNENVNSGWNNYRASNGNESYSRLTLGDTPDYIDGTPKFIINNIGINDSQGSDDPTEAVDLYKAWVEHIMGGSDGGLDLAEKETTLFLVMPYQFGRKVAMAQHYKAWHDAFQDMFSEVTDEYSNNVFCVDLQEIADTYLEYCSYDDLQPTKTGYKHLGELLNKYALQPFAPEVTIDGTEISWSPNNEPGKYGITHVTTNFEVQCSTDNENWDTISLQSYSSNSFDFDGEITTSGHYYGRVVALNNYSQKEAMSQAVEFDIID